MLSVHLKRDWAAVAPKVQMSFGFRMESWVSRCLMQFETSCGIGFLFSGGLHLRILQIKTSLRFRPLAVMILSNNSPALPTKGNPSWSSLCPGASPMKTRLGWELPSPNTVFVLSLASGSHETHALTLSLIKERAWRASSSLKVARGLAASAIYVSVVCVKGLYFLVV